MPFVNTKDQDMVSKGNGRIVWWKPLPLTCHPPWFGSWCWLDPSSLCSKAPKWRSLRPGLNRGNGLRWLKPAKFDNKVPASAAECATAGRTGTPGTKAPFLNLRPPRPHSTQTPSTLILAKSFNGLQTKVSRQNPWTACARTPHFIPFV